MISALVIHSPDLTVSFGLYWLSCQLKIGWVSWRGRAQSLHAAKPRQPGREPGGSRVRAGAGLGWSKYREGGLSPIGMLNSARVTAFLVI